MPWLRSTALGATLAVLAATANAIPSWFDVTGVARADRSAPMQAVEFLSLILDSGWAWAVAAIVAGRLCRRWWAGSVTLVVAALLYDTLESVIADGSWWGNVRAFWVVGGALLGVPLGIIGAAIHRRGRWGSLASLVAPSGAALAMVVHPPDPDSAMATPVRVTVLTAAAVLAAAVIWARRPAAAPAARV
ncbi:hypothetical protein [Paractinoplanes deccanensis]|uniref:hypothetical protein n=1 Tax=Paractinoplanes deccanensis TaxID=113561 RepID=UPI0019443AB3|nr:hypothetical protein [Actinoplanes deccanensis]